MVKVGEDFLDSTIVFRFTDDVSISIKAPQLVGIVCGICVFTVTIAVVVYLMFKSGSIARFLEEMQQSPRSAPSAVKSSGGGDGKKAKDSKQQQQQQQQPPPQFDTRPELYEHLLEAAKTLPLQPSPPVLQGRYLEVRPLQAADIPALVQASNGSALAHESAYDPVARIWGWLTLTPPSIFLQPREEEEEEVKKKEGDAAAPAAAAAYASEAEFARHFGVAPINGTHLVIVDTVVGKPVGMLSLVANQPSHLRVRIDNLWLTPAYQGDSRKLAHEAMLLVLGWLVEAGYRRIECEVDVRHVVMRKFVERCGFQSEAVLRKHRIVSRRNRDSCLYVLLNSEWADVVLALKRHLRIELGPKLANAAAIDTPALLPSPK